MAEAAAAAWLPQVDDVWLGKEWKTMLQSERAGDRSQTYPLGVQPPASVTTLQVLSPLRNFYSALLERVDQDWWQPQSLAQTTPRRCATCGCDGRRRMLRLQVRKYGAGLEGLT